MATILLIIAFVLAYLSTKKFKGLVRIGATILVAMFYFFALVFFYLLFGRI